MKIGFRSIAVLTFCLTLQNLLFGQQQETTSQQLRDLILRGADPRISTKVKAQEGNQLPASAPSLIRETAQETTPRTVSLRGRLATVYPNIRMHPNSTTTQSEMSIAVHPTNPNTVLAGANAVHTTTSVGSHGWYYTTNGGTSWLGGDTLPSHTNLSDFMSDPAVGIDLDGNLFASALLLGSARNVFVARSTNNGGTWSATTVADPSNDEDKNHLAVDVVPGSPFESNVYAAYTDFSVSPSPIKFSRSTDRGQNFSGSSSISDSVGSIFAQGINLAVGPSGELYAAWSGYDSWPPPVNTRIGFNKSTNGGATWQGAHTVRSIADVRGYLTKGGNSIRVSSFPSMAVDRSSGSRRGWIYVVYPERTGTTPDIFLIRSTNEGTTWSTPKKVNQDISDKDQWYSWVTVDPATGGLYVVYYDSRNFAANDSAQVYISSSLDGGDTFDDVLVSDAAFLPAPIPGLASGYSGDYLGIAALNGIVWPCWNDNRTGIHQAYTSRIVFLSVGSPATISVVPDTLDFGTRYQNVADTLQLSVRNLGYPDTLFVTSITSSNSSFTTDVSSFSLPGGNGRTVKVRFDASTIGFTEATLTIASNDTAHPTTTVVVRGNVIYPPVIGVTPDSLSFTLNEGDSAASSLTIKNSGLGVLNYDISNELFSLTSAVLPEPRTIPREEKIEDRIEAMQAELHFVNPPMPGKYARRAATSLKNFAGAQSVIFHDDMESGLGGWTTQALSGANLWHITSTNYNSPSHSWWCGIEGQGNYDNGQRIDNEVISPSIDLRGQVSAALEFYESFSTESGWDYCMVDVTTDGGISWVSLRGSVGSAPSGSSGGWVFKSYDLSLFVSQVIKIRFYFDTRDGIAQQYPGWFFDDVTIHGIGGWLSENPTSGTVAPGDSAVVGVRIITDYLDGGTFHGNIIVGSNDPVQPTVSVPVKLVVIGTPNIVLSDDSLNYGDMYINYPDTLTLRVSNNGSDTLRISSIVIDDPQYVSLDPTVFNLAPHAYADVRIRFIPTSAGTQTGTLSIASNDASDPIVSVTLVGDGIYPPIIGVVPDSLSFTMNEGDSLVSSLTVNNTGLGTLMYTIQHSYTSLLAARSISAVERVELFSAAREVVEQVTLENGGPEQHITATVHDQIVYQQRLARYYQIASLLNLTSIGLVGGVSSVTQSLLLADSEMVTRYTFVNIGDNYTLTQLQAHQGIIVNEYDFNISQTESDALRDYMNSGRPVLLTMDDLDDEPVTVRSDMLASFGLASTIDGNFYFGTLNTAHPITTEITTMGSLGSENNSFTLNSAEWVVAGTDGNYYVTARSTGSRRVMMGEEFSEWWNASSRLVKNAINWTFGVGNWLSESPTNGTVSPGGSANIDIKIKTDQLDGGTFHAAIKISSNDPANSMVSVPVYLRVIGTPNIVLSDDTLNFGDVFINYRDTLTLRLSNNGSDTLKISGINISDSHFTLLDPAVFNISPNQSRDIRSQFLPTVVGSVSATLSILSNDPSDPTTAVALLGNGIYPPVISINPDSLAFSIFEGDSTSTVLTIQNAGLGSLTYSLETEGAGGLNQFSIPLYFYDMGMALGTVQFGIHPLATYGIDYSLGEYELPPPPPWTVPDVRFTNIPGRYELGQGVTLDLRGAMSMPQTETYQVQFQPSSWGYPVMVSWPSGLNAYVNSLRIFNPYSGQTVDVNMLSATGVVITDPTVNRLMITSVKSADWLSLVPTAGTILPSNTASITVKVKTVDLDGGTFHGTIKAHSNDPIHPIVNVPVSLTVVGMPNLVLSDDTLNYGETFIDHGKTLMLRISNSGSVALHVTGMASNNSLFSVIGSTPFYVPANQYRDVGVRFMPIAPDSQQGFLTIHSDDPVDSIVNVAMIGKGIHRPVVGVEPDSIGFRISQGDSASTPLVVKNSGLGQLDFAMSYRGNTASSTRRTASVQPNQYMFSIDVFDNGPGHASLGCGIHPNATYGIDPALGEYELPPLPPPGAFDARLIDLPWRFDHGQGVNLDLRRFISFTQVDTYHIAYQTPAGGFPVRLYWPSGLGAYVSSLRLVNPGSGQAVNENMLTTTSYVITDSTVTRLYVISVGAAGDWLTFTPPTGSVAPGDSQQVMVDVKSTLLNPGSYFENILVTSNDPFTPDATVLFFLRVLGVPNISLADDTLDFGDAFVGFRDTLSLRVSNTGTDSLVVDNIDVVGSNFNVVDTDTFALAPTEFRDVRFEFLPTSETTYTATGSFHSTDPNDSVVVLQMRGRGVPVPIVSVSPDSLSFAATEGDSTSGMMYVSNLGLGTLKFTLIESDEVVSLQAESTSQPPKDPPLAVAMSEPTVPDVLIIQDTNPWGWTSLITVLVENHISFRIVNSTTMVTTDFAPYHVIIIPSDQRQSTYDAIAANIEKFNSYVANGGLLEFHAAGWGPHGGDPSAIVLPGGVHINARSSTQNIVLMSSHPIVAGVASPFTGTTASNAYFTTIPVGATHIAKDNVGGINLIEYYYGDGRVVASGQTLEYGFEKNESAGVILKNMVPYAVSANGVSWIITNPSSGTLAAGESLAVKVKINTGTLDGGIASARLQVQSNDPANPTVPIPVRVQVFGAPIIQLNHDTLNYGSVYISDAETLVVKVKNIGSEILHVSGISSSNTEFSPIDPTVFNVAPLNSRNVRVQFQTATLGWRSGILTIISDASHDSMHSVQLLAYVMNRAAVAITPDSVAYTLTQGDSASSYITVSNFGVDTLDFTLSVAEAGVGAGNQSGTPNWLAVSPLGGAVSPGNQQRITLQVTTDRALSRTYRAVINMTTNDPLRSLVDIPVDLRVVYPLIRVESDWNLLSVPLKAPDYKKDALFPAATSSAFAFDDGYSAKDTLRNGDGYWMKFDSSDSFAMSGDVFVDDTIDVKAKWNIIGVPSYAVRLSQIVPIPPTTIVSDFFGFENIGGYYAEDTLKPARGYWVRVSGAGKIVLRSGFPYSAGPAATTVLSPAQPTELSMANLSGVENLSRITFTDGVGKKRSLFFTSNEFDWNPELFELPPPPPAEIFDVRFSSQRQLEAATPSTKFSQGFPINISCGSFPLLIHWEIAEADEGSLLELVTAGRNKEKHLLKGTGDFSVTDARPFMMTLYPVNRNSAALPKEFALHQNYPNPFNPTTRIRYDLPEEMHVSMKIYDILGREVETLVDEIQPAGYRTVVWNGTSASSGLYFYRIVANSMGDTKLVFTQIRKMMLVK